MHMVDYFDDNTGDGTTLYVEDNHDGENLLVTVGQVTIALNADQAVDLARTLRTLAAGL